MNKKVLTYILVIAIMIIWGNGIYMLMNRIHNQNNTNTGIGNFVPPELPKSLMDTFHIKADYRDPFLGGTKKVSVPTNTATIIKPVPIPVVIKWPTITYFGMIKNQKSNKQLVIVTIDGQSHNMKTGSIVSEVTLNKIYKDSIEVTYQKNKKIIKK